MNLNKERSRQKLQDVLESVELTDKNSRLAEQYLDVDLEEDRELLAGAEPQDFSELRQEVRDKCREYKSYCLKRNLKEELGRFVRFAASVGGSTAYYVLAPDRYNIVDINSILEYLTREQAAAVRAEGIVWNIYEIKTALTGLVQKTPQVLRDAMELCYHKSDNAKSLLAAVSLHYTKPEKPAGGVIKALFSGGSMEQQAQKAVQKTVQYLESNLTDSMENIFTVAAPSDEDMKKLISFVQSGAVDQPFPQEIVQMLQGRKRSDYLIALLAGEAFLAIEHSRQCAAFVMLALAMDVERDQTMVLDVCLNIGGSSWFFRHIEALEEYMPMPREDYIVWCLKNCKYGSPVKRVIKDHPEVVRQLIKKVSTEEFQHLLAMAKNMNPMLYQELNRTGSGEFRMKLAQELTTCYKNGKNEAMQYLLGEAELETLYPYVKEWRGGWDYDTRKCQRMQSLKKHGQELQMYQRAVVLEGLCMRARYFSNYWYKTWQRLDVRSLSEIIELFEAQHLPVSYQLEALSAIYDSYYPENDKTDFINECCQVLCKKKDQWGAELAVQAREGIALVRCLCIRVLEVYRQEYKEVLLSCAVDSSRQVRELLVAVYEGIREWEPDIRKMLESRKSQEREMAILVLKRWGVDGYRKELEAALAKEKSKKIRELLESCLGAESGSEEAKKDRTKEEQIKETLKGGKKRKLSWVYEKPLPGLHRQDGVPAAEDQLAAILVCYADMGIPGVSKEAAALAEDLNPEELAQCMETLFERWMETGAEAKKKWVLYAASIHGGERIIPVLHTQIQEWPKASRGTMAAEAVKALALNGSPTALLLVDQISRKFKFRQVKAAAGDALSCAANQLGITKAELEDRIVPNLGFNEQMEQVFDYGPRKFQVLLSAALELEVYDGNGKRLKNLPAPGKKDEPEKAKAAGDAYRLLKKQLKTVVANQKLRLEQAMSAERLWQVAQWKELFVKNPVMHQFAIGLIWGVYEDKTLKATFRYMEDGSFNTVDEEAYELPQTGTIGLVHPIELEEESLAAWKEQLSDYEVIQPIEQMERTVYRPTEEEKEQTELTRFGGKLINGLSLSGRLQNMGWYRGSVQDAGGYYTFYREDGDIGVELEFSGCFIGDENEEVTVYGAQFYRAGTVKRGSYVYDTVKEEHRYKPGEVSPRYFSEIVLQLTKATASSQEQLAYPECKNIR